MAHPSAIPVRLSYYEKGRASVYACANDQRFAFCLFVPSSYRDDAEDRWQVLVAVHGAQCDAQRFRDELADFAELRGVIVLAPLFPARMRDRNFPAVFQLMRRAEVRFDAVLLSILMQAASRYRLESSRVLLFGRGAGAGFVNRFVYLHPERVIAATVAVPDLVTRADPDLPWPAGLGAMEQAVGSPPNLSGLADLKVQLISKAEDSVAALAASLRKQRARVQEDVLSLPARWAQSGECVDSGACRFLPLRGLGQIHSAAITT